jgi:hypothetical protein
MVHLLFLFSQIFVLAYNHNQIVTKSQSHARNTIHKNHNTILHMNHNTIESQNTKKNSQESQHNPPKKSHESRPLIPCVFLHAGRTGAQPPHREPTPRAVLGAASGRLLLITHVN